MIDLQQSAFRLAIIFVLCNTFLMMAGVLPASTLKNTYHVLQNMELTNVDSSDFEEGTILKTDTNSSAQNLTGNSFFITVLDFIQAIPVIGPLVPIASVLYELATTSTFGFVILLNSIGVPSIIMIPVTVAVFLVYAIAAYELLADLLRSFGGVK